MAEANASQPTGVGRSGEGPRKHGLFLNSTSILVAQRPFPRTTQATSTTMNSSDFSDGPQVPAFLQPVVDQYTKYTRMYQYQIDRTAPHTLNRWLATLGLNALFMLRIVLAQGVSDHCCQTP